MDLGPAKFSRLQNVTVAPLVLHRSDPVLMGSGRICATQSGFLLRLHLSRSLKSFFSDLTGVVSRNYSISHLFRSTLKRSYARSDVFSRLVTIYS